MPIQSRLVRTLALAALLAMASMATVAADDDAPSCRGREATIVGTDAADLIVGTEGDDVIWAGDGDDEVRGGGGDDRICGGSGDDRLFGGEGDDLVAGGSGDDLVVGGSGDDRLIGNRGADSLRGGAGLDVGRAGAGDDQCVSVGTASSCERRSPLLRPVPDVVESVFGPRLHPILGDVRMHTGWDFDSVCGTPITSMEDGVVTEIGVLGINGGYGNTVVVDHGGGLATLYAHLETWSVEVGDTLVRGEVLGTVGTTGLSTGCHLHAEVRVDDIPIDPTPYLCPERHPRGHGHPGIPVCDP